MSVRVHIPGDSIQHRVGDLLARHLAAANLLGRAQIVREAKRKTGKVIEIATSSRLNHGHHHFAEDGEDTGSIGFSLDLPNDDAADYIRGLTPVTKDTFDGLSSQYKKDAFTLAGAADVRLIEKVRDELADAAAKGSTSDDFQKAVQQITSDAGVTDLNAFTLDTAFNVAMQKAYSLGRYEQMSDAATMAVLPYWQYWTVGDDRVRPEHAVLDQFTARGEDPVWMKIYPPNGFNCRCAVVPVLPEEAPKDADEPGLERLPMLARMLVPQPGFGKVFAEIFAA
jgi:SPP1 gp7 family putative phage head morphogenesis protein